PGGGAEEAHARPARTELDPVAGLEQNLLHPRTLVDDGAVRAGVVQRVAPPLLDDLAVARRHSRVASAVEGEIAVGVASQGEDLAVKGVALPLEEQPGRAGVEPDGPWQPRRPQMPGPHNALIPATA